MSEPERPPWHWDEVRALHGELAEQTETAATIIAALKAEVERLELRAQAAEERARRMTLALARALLSE